MYHVTRTITLRDADAAGVLFFARYLSLAHDVYEEFMASRGINFRAVLHDGEMLIPVIHAESDYHTPLHVGEKVTIRLEIAEVRRRTFTVYYEFCTEDGSLAAACKTVHVAVDRRTGRATPMPDMLLKALKVTREECEPPAEE